ncbi:amidohydrolase [Niabella sp. CC-SYL272]|uniref:amidohydrolase n=1 Tax=Niabella agricola TaxID=2891571 RepID=UPI001F32A311|nr:amidohydrolase [Niabella agricola]MCF3110498.1 amidohydrolase [Niabella agricola]
MSLTITLIQTRLHWEDKTANRSMLQQKIENITEKAQIIVLPEMFSTGFSMRPELLAETMDGPTIQWMREIAAAHRVILTGSLIIKEGTGYFNRLIWMLPNGQYGLYDKRHRFAFAGEDQHYTAGNKRLIASVNGWKIHLQVCYDLRFPVWARQNMGPTPSESAEQPEYDLLLNVANWPQRRSLAWKTLLQARAIENQCYVVGVNRVGEDGNGIYYSGDSMVIDPLGEILYHKADEEDIHTITLHKTKLEEVRNKFPFWRDADRFFIS